MGWALGILELHRGAHQWLWCDSYSLLAQVLGIGDRKIATARDVKRSSQVWHLGTPCCLGAQAMERQGHSHASAFYNLYSKFHFFSEHFSKKKLCHSARISLLFQYSIGVSSYSVQKAVLCPRRDTNTWPPLSKNSQSSQSPHVTSLQVKQLYQCQKC